MTSQRYYNVFRHRPESRAQKRLLNRARACGFCGQPLDAGRYLFRCYTGFSEYEIVPAHPACAEAEVEQIGKRRAEAFARPPRPADLAFIAALCAAEDRAVLGGNGRPHEYAGLLDALGGTPATAVFDLRGQGE